MPNMTKTVREYNLFIIDSAFILINNFEVYTFVCT